MTKPSSKRGLFFILITLVVDAIGFGLIIPVMPALLKELSGQSAVETAPWSGYLAMVYAAMTFLFGPLIGNLSDRFGRRPVLLLALAALAIDYIIMGFANSIAVLFVGRVLSGICGATFSTANAYIADITTEEERGRAFGLTGAAFGIGFILGPVFGGMLGLISARAPFFAAAILAGVNMLYGWWVLPESLAVKDRRKFDRSRANPLGAFSHFASLPTLWWFLAAVFFYNFAHNVYQSTWGFHGDARYGWKSQGIGISLMAFGIMSTIVQGGLIGLVLKKLGPVKTAVLGFAFNVTAFTGFAFASDAWMIYAWIPVASMGAITGPAINSLMSARVGKSSQGELQGALASVQGVASMVSPVVMTKCFHFFLSDAAPFKFFGSAFLLASALTLLAVVPFLLAIRRIRENIPDPEG